MILIKEIRSKSGELHFKRWSILSLPWFSIYIHGIYKKDMDRHLHSHPWNIWTMILKGGYVEVLRGKDGKEKYKYRGVFNTGYRSLDKFHKIGRLSGSGPTYSLAIVGRRKNPDWGFMVNDKFVDHLTYRENKNRKRGL